MITKLKITVTGNLTADPSLEATNDAKPYAKARLAVNEGQGESRTTDYFDLRIWASDFSPNFPENVVASLHVGDRVTVTGRIEASAWTSRDGVLKSGITLHVDEISPSLRYATAVLTRNDRAESPAPSYGANSHRPRPGHAPVLIQPAMTATAPEEPDPFGDPF
jgi:single-strand DNA-binding protein